MKPLHIALLLAAGAAGGALVMTVAQHQREAPSSQVAQVPTGAQALSEPPAAPPATAPAEPAPTEPTPVVTDSPATKPAKRAAHDRRPSPWEAPRPGRTHTTPPPSDNAPQSAVAQATPAPVVAAPPVSAEPTRDSVPPARVEPEHATPVPPPAPPPEPTKVTLNAGTLLSVRLVDGLSAERNVPGDLFTATLDKELVVDGFVIAERGARVEGRVTASDRGGRVRGVSTLSVELTRLRTSDGQNVSLRTDPFERRAQETHGQDAAKVGGGAALGAIIGAIAGGGKGAAIGAGAGGAAGAGTVMATRGKPAVLSSETRISFRLSAPVTLTERR